VGIPLADLPHIFDRFFRSIKTASYQEGSGIGLAIAAWIIDRHRGKVTVQSELGTGTTFKVWLPAHK
jgi:signal transduction histidine kinase